MIRKITLLLALLVGMGYYATGAFAQVEQRMTQAIVVNGQQVQGVAVIQNGAVQNFTCPAPQPYVTTDQSTSGWACYDETTGAWMLNALPPANSNVYDQSSSAYYPNYPDQSTAYGYGYPDAYPYYPYPYSYYYPYGWGWPAVGFGFGFGNFNNGHFHNFNNFNNGHFHNGFVGPNVHGPVGSFNHGFNSGHVGGFGHAGGSFGHGMGGGFGGHGGGFGGHGGGGMGGHGGGGGGHR